MGQCRVWCVAKPFLPSFFWEARGGGLRPEINPIFCSHVDAASGWRLDSKRRWHWLAAGRYGWLALKEEEEVWLAQNSQKKEEEEEIWLASVRQFLLRS